MSHIALLIDPGVRLDELITARTRAVHLWSQLFVKQASSLPPNIEGGVPPTSPLGQISDSSMKPVTVINLPSSAVGTKRTLRRANGHVR